MAIDIFKEENRRQIVSLIIFFILLIIFLYLLYYLFLRPSSEETKITPRIYKKVKVDFSLFEKPKFKKISSPPLPELREEKPGRENPFIPFE